MTLASELRAQRLLSTSWLACPKGAQSLDMLLDYMNNDPRLADSGVSPLTRTPLAIKRFRNLERLPSIEDSVRDNHVYLTQCFTQGEDPASTHLSGEILDLLFSVYTSVSCHADRISLDLGFFPYGRSDKVFRGGQAILSKIFFKMLDTAAEGKGRQILTYDLHNDAISGFVEGFRMDAVSAAPLFAMHLKTLPELKEGVPLKVLAPDEGGVKRAKLLAGYLNCGFAYSDKSHGQGEDAKVNEIIGDVKDCVVAVYDDVIDSGKTAIENAELAIKKGAQKVIILGTHCLFSKEEGKPDPEHLFRSKGFTVVGTDTVPRSPAYLMANRDWLTMITVAGNKSDLLLGPYFGDRVRDVRSRYETIACSKQPFDDRGRLVIPTGPLLSSMHSQDIAYSRLDLLTLPNAAYCRAWKVPDSFLKEYFNTPKQATA